MTEVSGDGQTGSVVYIVRLGKFVKIGFSTCLPNRLVAFQTTNPVIDLLLAIPGDRELEKRLHRLLSEFRIRREMFHEGWRLQSFIYHAKNSGLQDGLEFLESTMPEARSQKKQSDHEWRVCQKRMDRAQLDAFFADLVAERKRRLGW